MLLPPSGTVSTYYRIYRGSDRGTVEPGYEGPKNLIPLNPVYTGLPYNVVPTVLIRFYCIYCRRLITIGMECGITGNDFTLQNSDRRIARAYRGRYVYMEGYCDVKDCVYSQTLCYWYCGEDCEGFRYSGGESSCLDS